MRSKLLLILILAFQPLTLQGVAAVADVAQSCFARQASESSAAGCCGSMAMNAGCPMHSGADACPCMVAPTTPMEPTPAPPAVTGPEVVVVHLPVVSTLTTDTAPMHHVCARNAGQSVLPVAHNRAQARLGVWRT